MTPFQVFLLATGFVIIALSYIISEKFLYKREEKQITKTDYMFNLLEDDNQLIKKKVEEICDIEAERTIDQVKEKLSKISNEKIMAINEFSEQILEKTEQNHSEVVFLYNMLNDKEEKIKVRELVPPKIQVPPKTQVPTKSVTVDKAIDYGKELNANDIKEQELTKKRVLQLYSDGSSIIEIAKLLEIGQGEIKLIIQLARGIKNET